MSANRTALDVALDMLFSIGSGSDVDHVLFHAREELEYLRSAAHDSVGTCPCDRDAS